VAHLEALGADPDGDRSSREGEAGDHHRAQRGPGPLADVRTSSRTRLIRIARFATRGAFTPRTRSPSRPSAWASCAPPMRRRGLDDRRVELLEHAEAPSTVDERPPSPLLPRRETPRHPPSARPVCPGHAPGDAYDRRVSIRTPRALPMVLKGRLRTPSLHCQRRLILIFDMCARTPATGLARPNDRTVPRRLGRLAHFEHVSTTAMGSSCCASTRGAPTAPDIASVVDGPPPAPRPAQPAPQRPTPNT
jgi:hypothetical protein